MKFLVTYERRGGTTRRGAQAIEAALKDAGHEAASLPGWAVLRDRRGMMIP